ncbi:putative fic/DOC family protein [Lyophyllum shimeji]|uniref:Fic/DOC family protein n=1 Tax=Lyophyllum shimeji TaxID=47721 RepID=A0A9P3PYC6_LYOSH|nr:putative fic/DOC family protein [Lyophyllum shimeji]
MMTVRLARIFTPEYARRVNAQIVYPCQARVVKPNELESALARPVNVARYEPDRPVEYLAATLSYGLIKGHPFFDGNKRTAFFLANEYLRAHGLPGLLEECEDDRSLFGVADRHINVAAGLLDVAGLDQAHQVELDKVVKPGGTQDNSHCANEGARSPSGYTKKRERERRR